MKEAGNNIKIDVYDKNWPKKVTPQFVKYFNLYLAAPENAKMVPVQDFAQYLLDNLSIVLHPNNDLGVIYIALCNMTDDVPSNKQKRHAFRNAVKEAYRNLYSNSIEHVETSEDEENEKSHDENEDNAKESTEAEAKKPSDLGDSVKNEANKLSGAVDYASSTSRTDLSSSSLSSNWYCSVTSLTAIVTIAASLLVFYLYSTSQDKGNFLNR